MDMDVVGNKERLLKGILDGETTTDIEPASREERLLKAILENGGGSGGGATSVTLAASGDNLSGDISLADLKTALSNGVVLLSFPTEGTADERVVAEYTDDSTNGLRIGVFSEDEYIVYSVVDDGNGGVTLTVVGGSGLGGGLIVTLTVEGTVTDRFIPNKTWSQIKDALAAGQQVTLKTTGNVREYVIGAGKLSPTVWGVIAGACTGSASNINIFINSYSIQKVTDADTCYVDKIRQATI